MSAQAGVLFFDRRPIEPTLVAHLGRCLDPFGPDGAGDYVAEGLAMLHRALHVTPQDQSERQPYVSPRGTVITWDGRLDNREELLFEVWRDLRMERSDAALAVAIYDRAGRAGLSKLVGDWSCVIWDRADEALTFASDYMGIRPLHLYCRPDAVWWATTLECLVDHHRLHDQLEPRFLVGALSMAMPAGLTPYAGIVTVPSGSTVTIRFDGVQETRRFWTFDVPRIRYRDVRDYEAHLRDLFVRAVQVRLRSTRPVWAELSGGLDSSSIVCAAHVLVQDARVPAPRLETVSYVPEGAPEADERRYAEVVDAYCQRSTHYLSQEARAETRRSDRAWITPRQPSGILLAAYQLVQQSGDRLLLGGEGGDTVMGNYQDHHYDVAALVPAHPLRALALARRRALASQRPILHVMRDACAERLPARWIVSHRLSALIRQTAGRPSASDADLADVFALRPEYVEGWRAELARDIQRGFDCRDVAHRRQARELMTLADGRHMQNPSDDPIALRSYPYLHRPLVAFVLGIPIEILVPPGQPRGLMRRAFEPFVPPRVLGRFSKGYASPFIVRQARTLVARWLERPEAIRVARLDCIDRSRLMRYLESVRDNTQTRVGFFVTLFALEQWLAAREEQRPAFAGTHPSQKGGERHGISEAIA